MLLLRKLQIELLRYCYTQLMVAFLNTPFLKIIPDYRSVSFWRFREARQAHLCVFFGENRCSMDIKPDFHILTSGVCDENIRMIVCEYTL